MQITVKRTIASPAPASVGVLLDPCRPGLQFLIDRLGRGQYGLSGLSALHVGHDASPPDVVTLYVGQVFLQTLSRSDEVSAVLHGYDHHQSAVGLLASHSLAVAQVLCEAKRVAVAHALYDDEHRLHATLLVEAQEIAVDRVALRLREDLVGVADVAARVGEVHHRDVLCLPRLCVQSQHRRQ